MFIIKLHLGCGKRYIEGFTHVDVVKYAHVDYLSSVDRLDAIGDSSVSLIYSCHVLEHFHRDKVSSVLKEWNRVLVEGGVVRIAVPDFNALCNLYVEKKDIGLVIGPVVGRQNYLYNIHYNIFDFDSLKSELESAGFTDIELYDWRDTEHSNIDDFSQSYYPHMEKDGGLLLSLNVEAVKK